jgi:hypothetical protein
VEQFAGESRAQRLSADQRANAADRDEVRRRYGAAVPEKQGHDAEALASGIDGKCPELVIERAGERTQEKPVMITGHPDALTDFGFVCLLAV